MEKLLILVLSILIVNLVVSYFDNKRVNELRKQELRLSIEIKQLELKKLTPQLSMPINPPLIRVYICPICQKEMDAWQAGAFGKCIKCAEKQN